jgi:predicted adenine nucleotide alpha hydrolase (AANH) superfamily ATPase
MKRDETVEANTPILLHCCCGPCSTSSIERLKELGYLPTLYYANSNIFPREEWEKRYHELEKVSSYFSLPISKREYDHDSWLHDISGYEGEKEGGERCALCFEHNLKEAAQQAVEQGFSYFTTTLSVSPHKRSITIFSVGENHEGFVPINFKKKGGFQRSIELSNELDLYRQEYCGCEFSMRSE